jgi:hypothetical protein
MGRLLAGCVSFSPSLLNTYPRIVQPLRSYMPKFIETDNLTSTSMLIVLLQLMILSLDRNWSGGINSIRRLLSRWHT